ncbi:vWA domain-containing protein [Verrucomicrobium sp. BvORR034]|uniref:vWA domain-containing protein n=1 Tax=Verrucomicrobium sp. BvORR034 TaxID=1396418 RepID=UPI002240F88A|nr:vWA domain-containing protein [Verrucomicrobium sp. BvORR034]
MSHSSFARKSVPVVQIRELRPPEDNPWHVKSGDPKGSPPAPNFQPPEPASSLLESPDSSPSPSLTPQSPSPPVAVSYWRRLGGGSLLVSLGIHAGLLTLAAFVVNTLVTERRVDFLPGGGSKQGEEASRELAHRVQTKRQKHLRNPVQRQRLVSTSDRASIALPDLPLEALEMPESGEFLGTQWMKAGGFGSLGKGGGSGVGMGIGSAKGVSFFGFTTPLDRVVFILDFSNSMKANQMDLVVAEMGKTLSKLPPRSQYQVILFAGGARFAGSRWKIDQQRGDLRNTYAVHRSRTKYRFFSPNGVASDWAFEGKNEELPSDDWIDSTPLHTRETMKDLEGKDRWFGTDWRWPFKMALNMSPAPKTIIFMTDGTGGADVDLILGYNKEKKANASINTFLMHTSSGAPAMQRLAQETGGRFHIVFNDGTPLDGSAYFANRGKYDQLLRENNSPTATAGLSAKK